jgi:NhaP-type Na+/H+ or K+/H+ antiporter
MGLLAGSLLRVRGVETAAPYLYATSLMLTVGLYGSTYRIDLAEARRDWGLLVLAISVGVVAKSLLIGGVVYLVVHSPLALLLGVVVAQIDPLSVASILADERMSTRARSILATWSSFDDAATAVLAVYASALAASAFGLGRPPAQEFHPTTGLVGYELDLALNLGVAGAVYMAWRLLRGPGQGRRADVLATALLAIVAAVAVWQFLVLTVAILGLFVRPGWLGRLLPAVVVSALGASAALLGVLLVAGIDPVRGIVLGLAAFGSQVVVGYALTHGLPQRDRVHLAFAQQNGITAIILALRLESQFPGVVAVVAPAILTANLTHAMANRLVDRCLAELYHEEGS